MLGQLLEIVVALETLFSFSRCIACRSSSSHQSRHGNGRNQVDRRALGRAEVEHVQSAAGAVEPRSGSRGLWSGLCKEPLRALAASAPAVAIRRGSPLRRAAAS